ncbi:uncharacterized protein LOC114298585 isoform X5 [Camellia sinensis]|uniref:uncharacterized protein LOC114298585 isoform X5 n=1 Tax=Camellia sinensis TaxID=4442 RepID=UPI001036E753|nr:uncharacterized protein LOC114298585 isoform X5 [Camellia sinensis]
MSRLYEMVKEGIEEHPLIHRPFAIRAASWAAWVCGVNRRNPEELVTDRWGLPSGICRFHMTCHSKDQIRGGWDSKCRLIQLGHAGVETLEDISKTIFNP